MEESVIEEVVYKKFEIEEEKEIFQFVEQQRHPVGGMVAFCKFVGEHLKHPPEARRASVKGNVKGKVYIQFIVNKMVISQTLLY